MHSSAGRHRYLTRTVQWVAGLSAASMLVACGGGDSSGAARLGEPAEVEAISSDPDAQVDPCALLSTQQISEVSDGGNQTRSGLSGIDNSLAECKVTSEDRQVQHLAFGFSMARDADVEARRSSITRTGGKVVAVPVGDVSFYSTSNGHYEAWGQAGAYTVFVSSLSYYPDKQQTETLLRSMLSKARPSMLKHPRTLPPACPKITDPRVSAVLGEVQYAAGRSEAADLSCDYGAGKLQLRLSSADLDRKGYRAYAKTADAVAGPLAIEATLAGAETFISANKLAAKATAFQARESRLMWLNLDPVAGLDASAELNSKLFKHDAFERLTRWWVPRRVRQMG